MIKLRCTLLSWIDIMAQWNYPYSATSSTGYQPQQHPYARAVRPGLLPAPSAYADGQHRARATPSFESELAKFQQEISQGDSKTTSYVVVHPPPPSGPQKYGGRVAFAPPPNLYTSSTPGSGSVADVLASMPTPVSRFPSSAPQFQPSQVSASHGPLLNSSVMVNRSDYAPLSAISPAFNSSMQPMRPAMQLPQYNALANTNATIQAQAVERKLQDQAEYTRMALSAGKTVVTANKAMFEAQKAMVAQEKFMPVMGPTLAPTSVLLKAHANAANAKALASGSSSSATPVGVDSTKISKRQKIKQELQFVRAAGDHIWDDPTLAEWDPNDFRIFCGDLGNEVTDEILARAFRRYPSFQKAKVIREKNSKKSKGYGFVSFKDPHDYILAMKEMNGKYIGNRPIKLKKSNWKDRSVEQVAEKIKLKQKLSIR